MSYTRGVKLQGNACIHLFKKKYSCVICWPDRMCDCGSEKHYKNCCKKYPKVLQERQDAMKKAIQDRHDAMKKANMIYSMPFKQESKSGLEQDEKEFVQTTSNEKPCACGHSTMDRCLKCRIEKKESEIDTAKENDRGSKLDHTLLPEAIHTSPPLAFTSPPLAFTLSTCSETASSKIEDEVDKMCTEYLLSRCRKILDCK